MKKVKRINLAQDVPAQVAEWLEDAAFTLAALPANGCRPGGMRSYWPDIVADREDLDWPMPSDIRPPMPSSDEVSRMDLALSWLPLIEEREARVVVSLRLIVHPISGQNRYSWRKIGKKLGMKADTAKSRYAASCVMIARKVREPEFFSGHIGHFERM